MVFVSMPVRTMAKRNSFQVAMKAKRATTPSPGATMGTTTRTSAFSREQLSSKLDMPANLLRTSLRRSLIEVEQCLQS